jgi:hypothetical protein
MGKVPPMLCFCLGVSPRMNQLEQHTGAPLESGIAEGCASIPVLQVGLRTMLEQQADRFPVTSSRCKVKRCTSPEIGHVHARTVFQKHLDQRKIFLQHREMKGSVSLSILNIRIHPCLKEFPNLPDVAFVNCLKPQGLTPNLPGCPTSVPL